MQEGLDLFGQVAVTWPEVFEWCELVAGIPADSPRVHGYIRAWRVIDKVASAKASGTWPQRNPRASDVLTGPGEPQRKPRL